MQTITREDVERRLNDGETVIIEALPEASFRKYHLPGAINIPVDDEHFDETVAQAVPDKATPVVVYCLDPESQASPAAARRLDDLGYQDVYDYEGGKQDWTSGEKPVES